jgi:hypothetical protein
LGRGSARVYLHPASCMISVLVRYLKRSERVRGEKGGFTGPPPTDRLRVAHHEPPRSRRIHESARDRQPNPESNFARRR